MNSAFLFTITSNAKECDFIEHEMEFNDQSIPEERIPIQPEPMYAPPVEPVKKKKKKGVGCLGVVAVALSCSILGGLAGAGAVVAADRMLQTDRVSTILKGERENIVLDTIRIDTSRLLSAAEVYAANVNSTVGITTSITTNFWGYSTTSAASGSGFIISEDGYILTNHHVIEDSSAITVAAFDGTTYDAKLIGYDESNDVAVLKVEAEGLAPVVLGDSDNMNVGDSVVAIGNPLGELTFSLTAGAVSAMNREVTLSTSVTMDLIQTDCAINSGNSGGALFNMYGEVIGITNAKYSSSSGEASIDNIGFAIPINDILPIVESIIEKGYISKPYIGVTVYDVSDEAQLYGIPVGAAVQSVTEGGPAQQAGLQPNDVITAVNGEAITGSSDLVSVVGSHQAGDVLTLTVYRQGQYLELTLTVAEQISSAMGQESQQTQSQSMMPQYPQFPGGFR